MSINPIVANLHAYKNMSISNNKQDKIDTKNQIMAIFYDENNPENKAKITCLISLLIRFMYQQSFFSFFTAESNIQNTIDKINELCNNLKLDPEKVFALTKHRKRGFGIPQTLEGLIQRIGSKSYYEPSRTGYADIRQGENQALQISPEEHAWLAGFSLHEYNIVQIISKSYFKKTYTFKGNDKVIIINKHATEKKVITSGNNVKIINSGELTNITSTGDNAMLINQEIASEFTILGKNSTLEIHESAKINITNSADNTGVYIYGGHNNTININNSSTSIIFPNNAHKSATVTITHPKELKKPKIEINNTYYPMTVIINDKQTIPHNPNDTFTEA